MFALIRQSVYMGMRPQCLRRDIYTQNIWNDVYTASLVMYLYKVHSDIIMARQLKCIFPYYKKNCKYQLSLHNSAEDVSIQYTCAVFFTNPS